ncbi:hypothetical protein EV691_12962 [Azotobacter chroococcum]|uniref:Uncharacterized protein n=1 Tax=Azotobacter chroococcum TaxID=353 RepID=A0A4R1PJM2_9GAMM|nr:hypothetical protein EV691_12962 [Azotobacter chroococcum]
MAGYAGQAVALSLGARLHPEAGTARSCGALACRLLERGRALVRVFAAPDLRLVGAALTPPHAERPRCCSVCAGSCHPARRGLNADCWSQLPSGQIRGGCWGSIGERAVRALTSGLIHFWFPRHLHTRQFSSLSDTAPQSGSGRFTGLRRVGARPQPSPALGPSIPAVRCGRHRWSGLAGADLGDFHAPPPDLRAAWRL